MPKRTHSAASANAEHSSVDVAMDDTSTTDQSNSIKRVKSQSTDTVSAASPIVDALLTAIGPNTSVGLVRELIQLIIAYRCGPIVYFIVRSQPAAADRPDRTNRKHSPLVAVYQPERYTLYEWSPDDPSGAVMHRTSRRLPGGGDARAFGLIGCDDLVTAPPVLSSDQIQSAALDSPLLFEATDYSIRVCDTLTADAPLRACAGTGEIDSAAGGGAVGGSLSAPGLLIASILPCANDPLAGLRTVGYSHVAVGGFMYRIGNGEFFRFPIRRGLCAAGDGGGGGGSGFGASGWRRDSLHAPISQPKFKLDWQSVTVWHRKPPLSPCIIVIGKTPPIVRARATAAVMRVYDTATNVWSESIPLPTVHQTVNAHGLGVHSACAVFNNTLYVSGGGSGHVIGWESKSEFWSLDLSNPNHSYQAMFNPSGPLLCAPSILEGEALASSLDGNAMELFVWQRLAPMHYARARHAMVVVSGAPNVRGVASADRMFVIGGVADSKPPSAGSDSVPFEEYLPATNEWIKLAVSVPANAWTLSAVTAVVVQL